MWGALSDERTGLSFTIAAGPQQRSHSRVRVPWESRDVPFRLLLRLAWLRWRYSTPPPHGKVWWSAESECESYITIDGQSASLSWNKAPIWGLWPDFFITVRQLRVCWFGALSLTRGRVCRLRFLLVLASAVIFGSQSLGTRDHILLSQIRNFPFRRLVRLARLRRRYSTPPPHGID
jgi:hypothetical protein